MSSLVFSPEQPFYTLVTFTNDPGFPTTNNRASVTIYNCKNFPYSFEVRDPGNTTIASMGGNISFEAQTLNLEFYQPVSGNYTVILTVQSLPTLTITLVVSSTLLPTYSIVPNVFFVNEGGTVTWNITTTNFGNGTLYYTNAGSTVSSDFIDEENSGAIAIVNNSGTLTKVLKNDSLTETRENIIIQLRRTSTQGVILATAATVSVNDTSFSSVPTYVINTNANGYSNGQTITFTILTANVPNNTNLYVTFDGTATDSDFVNGIDPITVVINSGQATFNKTVSYDVNTSKILIAQLRSVSFTGVIHSTKTIFIGTTQNKIGTYPIAPQWLSPSNLGSYRSNSNVVIKLETDDCDPGGGTVTYDAFLANNGNLSALPPNLILEENTGIISGFLKYSSLNSVTYPFRLRVYKNSILTNSNTYREKDFSITVLGSVIAELKWSTDRELGSLYQGEQSELSIKAVSSDQSVNITYTLVSGSLPAGLTLGIDGTIQGKVSYSGSTEKQTFGFTVRAKDSSLVNQIDKRFELSIEPYSGKRFTSILLQPLLKLEQRSYYEEFIGNEKIFTKEYLYRPYDPYFGLQREVLFLLEPSIEEQKAVEYAKLMQNSFSQKRLEFGNLKIAVGSDENGNKLYELIYIELIDNMAIEQTIQLPSSFITNNQIVYPNSINNMRLDLETNNAVDEYLFPKYMRTIQDSSGIPLGRILHMGICYCKPGTGELILKNIKKSTFNFKKINFQVDRILVSNIKDENVAKYVLFPIRKVF